MTFYDKEMQLFDERRGFRVISAGMYDTLCQCIKCDYKFCQSIDAQGTENEDKFKHICPLNNH